MPHPILEASGLTPKEAEVYEILLRLGEVPVADILKETQDHPQVIYRALDGLTARGLVLTTMRRHRKHVRAEDPRVLEKLEQQRLEAIRQSIPELLALQKTDKEAVIRSAKGNEAVRSLRLQAIEILKEGETLYIIGASGDRYYEILREQHAEIERKRIKKKIWRKLISFESQRNQLEQDKFRELTEFRYLPSDYPVPTSTNIFGNTVATIIWQPEPIVITIESKPVAESYKHYFDALWSLAKS